MKRNWLSPIVFFSCIGAVTVTDIQGPSFRSPLVGHTVHDVPGIVTAKVRTAGFDSSALFLG